MGANKVSVICPPPPLPLSPPSLPPPSPLLVGSTIPVRHTAVAWVGESQMSAKLGGRSCCCCCWPPSLPPCAECAGCACCCCCCSCTVVGCGPEEGVASTSGWFTDGSVFLLLIRCFRFFSIVALKKKKIFQMC